MNKYNAKKTHAFGKTFDSMGEYKRAVYLMDCENQGIIQNLEYQIPYNIVINGFKVCKYVADFRYIKNGQVVVEDFKGMVTAIFKLKAKLVKACYGIDILIVKKPTQ